MQTQILHCKMLSKVLRKICFAEQNNCYAKFQTAIHTCILHSTNCSAKKMTEFDPWLIRNDFAENCRLIWVFSNFVQFNYMEQA